MIDHPRHYILSGGLIFYQEVDHFLHCCFSSLDRLRVLNGIKLGQFSVHNLYTLFPTLPRCRFFELIDPNLPFPSLFFLEGILFLNNLLDLLIVLQGVGTWFKFPVIS